MAPKRETVKEAERESGLPKDAEIGKTAHKRMHMPNHEFGECKEGTHYHDTHRGE